MTDNQKSREGLAGGGRSLFDHGMPECRCPADCGGRPEARQRLTPAYPEVKAVGTHPPELTYEPSRRGELVYDALNERLGVFMDRAGRIVYLRPERGGPEWEADPAWLERPPAARQSTRQPEADDFGAAS